VRLIFRLAWEGDGTSGSMGVKSITNHLTFSLVPHFDESSARRKSPHSWMRRDHRRVRWRRLARHGR